MNFKIILLLFPLAFIISCKSKRISSNDLANANAKVLLQEMIDNEQDFTFLKVNGNIKAELKDQKIGGQFSMRLQKDTLMWISLRVAFIEAYRVIISPDSFVVMDRLKKTYYGDNIQNLAKMLGTEPEFKLLQNTIIGNISHLNELGLRIVADENTIVYIAEQDSFTISMTPHAVLKRPQALQVEQENREGRLNVVYEVYQEDETGTYPLKTILLLENAEFKGLEINFSKFNEVEELSFPFKIPSSYKQGP
jgi:hypothetical protein